MTAKHVSTWEVQFLGLALIGYTAYRAYNVVMGTLPAGGDSQEAQIAGLVALMGLDFALLVWSHFGAHKARNDEQQKIADIMTVLQLVGITLTTVGDTVLTRYGGAGFGILSTVVTWAVPVIIVTNVGAVIAVKRFDPANQHERAEREIQAALESATLEKVRANLASMVDQPAQARADQMTRETAARYTSPIRPTEPAAPGWAADMRDALAGIRDGLARPTASVNGRDPEPGGPAGGPDTGRPAKGPHAPK